jgi:HEPN domain-containing protein
MKRTTREWVGKAEDDYRVAAILARGSEPFHDQVAFHSQQSAEKYLKALLEELGIDVEKTHELRDLLSPLLPYHPALRSLGRGFDFLSTFAVDPRYPGLNAKKRQAATALRWAGKVREACRSLLGVHPARRPRGGSS